MLMLFAAAMQRQQTYILLPNGVTREDATREDKHLDKQMLQVAWAEGVEQKKHDVKR